MRSPLLALGLALALVASACGGLPGQPPGGPVATPTPTGVSVSVAPAAQTTITQTVPFTGNVVAIDQVNVVPKQSGQILSENVVVGSQVKAGEVIAQLDHTTQDLSLESARAQLEVAQANLAKIVAGPRPEDVATAQLAVATAQSKLQALENGAKPASVASAQAAVDAAQQKLALMQAQGQPNAVTQARANLTAAQAKLQALVNGPRPVQVAPLEVSVEQAKDSLYSQQVSRDGQCNPVNPRYLCQSATAAVLSAENGVNAANANLREAVAPPAATDLQQAQAAVTQAQAAYNAAQTPYTPQDIKQAQDAVTQARANLALTAQPNTPQDLQQAQYAVQTAQEQLALAQAPYTPQDRQSAQASVDQARAGVDQALQAVKDTTVTAPTSGVVSAVDLNAGDIASTSTPIVTISSNAVKVEVPVQQSQVVDLKVGDSASISGVVLGTQAIPGKVTAISPSGNTQNRSFTVDVTPDQPGPLLPGMFVQVTIAVRVDQNVTVVPSSAVVQKENGAFVFAVQQGVAHQIPVQVGISNNNQTEIVQGIRPGQLVVVVGNENLTDGQRVAIASTTPVATPIATPSA